MRWLPLAVFMLASVNTATAYHWPQGIQASLAPLEPPALGGRDTPDKHQKTAEKEQPNGQKVKDITSYFPSLTEVPQSANHTSVDLRPDKDDHKQVSPDWLVAWFTGLLVLATCGLWVFTALLWWTTRKAVDAAQVANADARAAFADQKSEMAKQSNAMIGQLDEMKKSFVVDRAYMYLASVERDKTSSIGPGCVIQVAFRNFGKTPAIVSCIKIQFKYHKEPPSPFFSEDIGPLEFPLPVAAGDHFGPIPTTLSATEEEIALAKEGCGSIRYIANISYDDVRPGFYSWTPVRTRRHRNVVDFQCVL